jgi:hypothetical protein
VDHQSATAGKDSTKEAGTIIYGCSQLVKQIEPADTDERIARLQKIRDARAHEPSVRDFDEELAAFNAARFKPKKAGGTE